MAKKRLVRKLRHWKQRFDKNAKFIWRRPIVFQGNKVREGDPIPQALENNPTKLRRFWESKVIELAEFAAPNVATGQVPAEVTTYTEGQKVPWEGLPAGVSIEKGKGSWFVITVGAEVRKVNGVNNLTTAVAEIMQAAAEADDGQDGDGNGGSDGGEPE